MNYISWISLVEGILLMGHEEVIADAVFCSISASVFTISLYLLLNIVPSTQGILVLVIVIGFENEMSC